MSNTSNDVPSKIGIETIASFENERLSDAEIIRAIVEYVNAIVDSPIEDEATRAKATTRFLFSLTEKGVAREAEKQAEELVVVFLKLREKILLSVQEEKRLRSNASSLKWIRIGTLACIVMIIVGGLYRLFTGTATFAIISLCFLLFLMAIFLYMFLTGDKSPIHLVNALPWSVKNASDSDVSESNTRDGE